MTFNPQTIYCCCDPDENKCNIYSIFYLFHRLLCFYIMNLPSHFLHCRPSRNAQIYIKPRHSHISGSGIFQHLKMVSDHCSTGKLSESNFEPALNLMHERIALRPLNGQTGKLTLLPNCLDYPCHAYHFSPVSFDIFSKWVKFM